MPKQYPAPPPLTIDPQRTYTVQIETSAGPMTAELLPKEAPLAVNNFVFLAREGFYDGVIFHRVIRGFMIQGGDPTGTGRGGPGYRFNDEAVRLPSRRGTLAMANAGPNTNGSRVLRHACRLWAAAQLHRLRPPHGGRGDARRDRAPIAAAITPTIRPTATPAALIAASHPNRI